MTTRPEGGPGSYLQEGADAFTAGTPRDANPYAKGTGARERWFWGYDSEHLNQNPWAYLDPDRDVGR